MCVCFAGITTGFTNPIAGSSYRIVSTPTITKSIDRYYDLEKLNFIKELSTILYVCVTSDIWSTAHTSYMGVTIHWVETTTMKLVSKLLCCRHFISPHTNTRIAALLQDIFQEYGISNKVKKPSLNFVYLSFVDIFAYVFFLYRFTNRQFNSIIS